ncbi:MAG: Gfo/Idh/MocA family oxidoreductase [Armatimonadota bacterium]|nr:MAG: Gfo/Idh/MocA family oxidoreductase [Armatimonadota bacterium]
MKKVRVGIIGTGGIAQWAHIPGYQKVEGVEVAAFCDTNRETLKAAAEKFGVKKTYTDYRKMLASEKLDAVSVCTPNVHHAEPTVAALRAKAHVLVEKPIAMNATEGRAMVSAARKAKRLLMVGFNSRWGSEVQWLRRCVESGMLGDIYYGEATYLRRRGIPGWGVFVDKELSGGGPLIDVGVHMLDLALFLMGHPKPIAAYGSAYTMFGKRTDVVAGMGRWEAKKFSVEDFGVGMVRFDNGATLILKASWAANIGEGQHGVMLLGSDAGLSTSPARIYREEQGSLVDVAPADLPKVDTYAEEMAQFVKAIREGEPSPVPGEHGLMATAILDAVYESAAIGAEVAIK